MSQLIPTTIAAIGRVAKLGEFYDSRSDQFMHLSLFNGAIPLTSIESTENRETKLKYTTDNTLEEKFEKLDVSAQLKLSVLSGLFKLEGSGAFFKDVKKSARSAKASFVQTISTLKEQISITDISFEKLVNVKLLDQITDATHVVVGIQWGGHAFIAVEDTASENRDIQTVKGNLGVRMKFLSGKLSGKGSVDLMEKDKNEINKFNFEIYGDLLPSKLPGTLTDAIKFMMSTPNLLQNANNGKGKAVSYVLMPLGPLRKFWNLNLKVERVLKCVNESIVNDCVRLFDKFNVMDQELNDLVIDVEVNEFYLDPEEVDCVKNLQSDFLDFQGDIRKSLSENLVKIRSGEEEMSTLQEIIKSARKHQVYLRIQNIKREFTSIKHKITFLNYLKHHQVEIIKSHDDFDEFLMKNFEKQIYLLVFHYDNTNMSDDQVNLFIRMVKNKQEYGENALFAAVEYKCLFECTRGNFGELQSSENAIHFFTKGKLCFKNFSEKLEMKYQPQKNLWSFSYMQAQIERILNDLGIPNGFIYVHFPGELSPQQLWPTLEWEDVSSEFAGLFLRIIGGDSENFGRIQNSNIPNLHIKTRTAHPLFDEESELPTCIIQDETEQIDYVPYTNELQQSYLTEYYKNKQPKEETYLDAESEWINIVNQSRDQSKDKRVMKLSWMKDELRPKNMAIKVWRKIN